MSGGSAVRTAPSVWTAVSATSLHDAERAIRRVPGNVHRHYGTQGGREQARRVGDAVDPRIAFGDDGGIGGGDRARGESTAVRDRELRQSVQEHRIGRGPRSAPDLPVERRHRHGRGPERRHCPPNARFCTKAWQRTREMVAVGQLVADAMLLGPLRGANAESRAAAGDA